MEREEKIQEIYKNISYYYECLSRTEKMYPPDGGGHGYKWREEIRRAEEALKTLKNGEKNQDIEKIFENKKDNTEISPIVITINVEFKKYFAKYPDKLHNLSPSKFEELIADILKDFGFDVELTQATRDGGKDILAYMKTQIGTFLTFVECKRWSPTKHVGIEIVQRLYGVQQAKQANKSMIVTTSFFSKPAIEESKRYEKLMDLKDYNDLRNWLKKYEK